MIRRLIIHFLGIQPAVAGIVVKNGKVLLTRRSEVLKEGGKWCLPGGGMKKWEKSVDAVKREIREEIGLNCKNVDLLFVHEEFVRKLWLHANVFVFEIKYNGQKIKTNWEVSEYEWFTKEEISKMDLAFTHKEILNKYFMLRGRK